MVDGAEPSKMSDPSMAREGGVASRRKCCSLGSNLSSMEKKGARKKIKLGIKALTPCSRTNPTKILS